MSDLPANIDGRLGHDVTIVDDGGARIEGVLRSYHPQPSVTIELSDGTSVSYPATMVQQRPLRERVAELIDAEHEPCIEEGGCRFQAGYPNGVNIVVDQVIALVQSDTAPKEGDVVSCEVCGGYGRIREGQAVHDSWVSAAHDFVVA